MSVQQLLEVPVRDHAAPQSPGQPYHPHAGLALQRSVVALLQAGMAF